MLSRLSRRLSMSSGPPRRRLVVVVGATGTGKSQLAVSLAERFNGEIINGDALQMYKGLPIATNKISLEERRGISHHLLGCVGLEEEPWTVQDFHDRASKVMEEVRSRGKLPVLVGGTHYYMQALLFPRSLFNDAERERVSENEEEQQWPILAASSEVMLAELRRIDPEMAKSWHPRDGRKIRRSLQICLQTGRKASDVYWEQRESMPTGKLDGIEACETIKGDESSENRAILRDPGNSASLGNLDVLVLWTYSSSEILNQRLDKRVEDMVINGLLEEVQSMHEFLLHAKSPQQGKNNNIIDDTRGIWIAIGYKEMLPYVTSQTKTDEERQEALQRMKFATRQYAKSQNRWIRLKLLHAMREAGVEGKLFLLDATDNDNDNVTQSSSSSSWNHRDVKTVAGDIVKGFLAGEILPEPATLSDSAREVLLFSEAKESSSRSARYCESCGKTMMFESEWRVHLKSKGHKKAVKPKVDWKALYPKG